MTLLAFLVTEGDRSHAQFYHNKAIGSVKMQRMVGFDSVNRTLFQESFFKEWMS